MPRQRGVRSVNGQAVAHMAGTVRSAGRETADARGTSGKIRSMATLTVCKACGRTGLGFGSSTVLGGSNPAGRMSNRAVAESVVEAAGCRSCRLRRRRRQVREEFTARMALGTGSSVVQLGGCVIGSGTGRPVFGMGSIDSVTGETRHRSQQAARITAAVTAATAVKSA